jgi:uncharacterized protein (DUF2267 family)
MRRRGHLLFQETLSCRRRCVMERREVADEIRQQRHESRTGQTFMAFVRSLSAIGKFDEVFAIRAAAAVLCRLEQRLTAEEARDLEAQLPQKVQEILTECHRPQGTAGVHKYTRDEFIAAVAADLGLEERAAEAAVRAVFTAVRAWISEGEAADVAAQLPKDLEPLWAQPA